MKSTLRFFLPLLFVLSAAFASFAQDALYNSFRTPPSDARPFVRWWWNGNYVTAPEVLRELDVMKAAGIGGVEINPVAMPTEVPAESLRSMKALTWLSPEWDQVANAATTGAHERGMTADMIVGSGWPFGGRFVPKEEQIQRIALVKRELTGPMHFRGSIGDFAKLHDAERVDSDGTVPNTPTLAFLRLLPADLSTFDPGKEMLNLVRADGTVEFDIPAGKFVLYAGLHKVGYSFVKLGAPGADGPVVDHYNALAVRHYLDHLSSQLNPAMGGQLGNQLRAMFVDSLELDRSNWTTDFAAEFEKRRGYALAPYLPFVLDQDSAGDSNFADTVRRARYDYCKTLIELFQERFIATFIDWCHRNGVRGRMQTYGRETHPLEGSMNVDLPEAESWLWSDGASVVPSPTVVNKYVSSGAHLTGQKLVSFEAMTNAVPVFRETLEDFKVGLDLSLMTGVNHPVLHGFNYMPPEAGFPGWVRFGCYFNEKNPWWPYFHRWTDYSARMTSLLRQTTSTAQVAILAPRADEWSRAGLLYQPFPEQLIPWYGYHLWQALQQNGVSSDYISENVLQKANFEKGRIRFGPRSYQTLILEDVESLEPATAQALERYVQAGGSIFFIGKTPSRAPGLKNVASEDRAVREHIAAAMQARPFRVAVIDAPRQKSSPDQRGDIVRLGLPLADRESLLAWARDAIWRFSITPEARISNPSPWLSELHQWGDRRDIFFFANSSRTESTSFDATFRRYIGHPWRWDPETGERSPYPEAGGNMLSIHLAPEESLLLVFEPESSAAKPQDLPPATPRPGTKSLALTPVWLADFHPAQGAAPFTRSMTELIDLSLSPEKPLATFAGAVTYSADFDVANTKYFLLDLGRVANISEVTLNGTALGVRWYGQHIYDARPALRKGHNHVEIKVTTMLGNYAKSISDLNLMAHRWAFWFPPIPAGLIGPVRLVAPEQ